MVHQIITLLICIAACGMLCVAVPLVKPVSNWASTLRAQSGQHPRLSLVEWDQYNHRDVEGPGTYAFGYDVQDPESDNIQFRHEERLPNGTVVGSYGYVTPDGSAHIVKYTSDHRGYRAKTETTRRRRPIKVDQAIVDEINAAEMALQNENGAGSVSRNGGVLPSSYIAQYTPYQATNEINNYDIANHLPLQRNAYGYQVYEEAPTNIPVPSQHISAPYNYPTHYL